ncbi:MAG TPA: four-helix bundle copper-binding protein, partial [Fibrobacteria bacterium]|nr:four-helix bundle copper-binding protein [Fibrobacteria bacterium]
MHQESLESTMNSTIQAAIACAQACRVCASACLNEKEIDMLRECIRLNLDCAEICDLSAAYMTRESIFHARLCELCAEVCEA